jgi:hypothetical protein
LSHAFCKWIWFVLCSLLLRCWIGMTRKRMMTRERRKQQEILPFVNLLFDADNFWFCAMVEREIVECERQEGVWNVKCEKEISIFSSRNIAFNPLKFRESVWYQKVMVWIWLFVCNLSWKLNYVHLSIVNWVVLNLSICRARFSFS